MTATEQTNTNKRIWLGLGAAALFCLCAAGAAVLVFYQMGQRVQEGMKTDPESAAQAAHEIADYDLPAGYQEQMAMDLFVYSFVIIAPSQPGANFNGPMIMLAQFQAGADPEEMEKQIQQSFEQQAGNNGVEMKLIEVKEMVIRGEEVPVAIYEGTDQNGLVMRQLITTFPGKDGVAMLMIMGPASGWDQNVMDAFIESIR